MKAVITRVSTASVTIDGTVTGRIGKGFLVYLGVGPEDTAGHADKLADKLCGLRVFEDEKGKMNVSLGDAGGGLLIIPNFTLYGSCIKGRRPDFFGAAGPEQAIPLYQRFLARCRENGFPPQCGVFGANMQVQSVNDGPVTLIIDSNELMGSTRTI